MYYFPKLKLDYLIKHYAAQFCISTAVNETILSFHIQLIVMAWHPFCHTPTYSMDKSQILHVS